MDLSQFHFAYPSWLWAGIIIPVMWALFLLFFRHHQATHQLEKFIDSHLLPHLLIHAEKKTSLWKPLLLWSCVWLGLILALAGPRWDFREMETFSRDQSLVILLDLSKSMTATDIKPSRLVRAKQKIEDLLNSSKGIKIGLIAFAADPHMMTPLTDDHETIRYLLSPLENDLVHVQGSRLSSALNMASAMFDAEVGSNNAILIISDGGFEDTSAMTTAKKLADKGIVIYTMGMGTPQGAPLKDLQGNIFKKNGEIVLSKLEKEKLYEISKIGNGRYLDADYTNLSESTLLRDLKNRSELQLDIGKKNRFWNEHFYLMIFPILPIILWWFRKGTIITIALLFLSPTFKMEATLSDYFINSEEHAKQAFDHSDYETAIHSFQDPYRKGVSYYKSGNFPEAEKMFRQSSRPEIALNANYNLGNALVQQQKLDEAITIYEEVLKKWPDHLKTRENLELVKKMKDQQKQESSQSDHANEQKEQNSENNKDSDKQNKENNEDAKNSKENKNSLDQEKQNDSQQNQKSEHSEQQKNQENESSPSEKNQDQRDSGASKDNKEKEEDSSSGEEKSSEAHFPQDQNNQDNTSEAKNASDLTEPKNPSNEGKPQLKAKAPKSQEDLDADLWLDQMKNDPKVFLRHKFYLESKRNGTTQGVDPW